MPFQQAQKRPARRTYRPNKRMRRPYVPLYPKPETKYHNESILHNAVQNSTTLACNVEAGAGTTNRVGRKLRIKSLEVLLRAAAGSGPVRMVIYVPKTQSQTLTLTNPAQAIDNDQFWVVKDGWVQPQGNNAAEGIYYRHSFPLGLVTEYDGNTASDVIKNGIKVLLFATNSTTILGHTKIWFMDN